MRKPLSAVVAILSVFVALAAFEASARATTITFDDLADSGTGTLISNGYQGLNWTNFRVANTTDFYALVGPNGYTNGTVSPSNVAYNGFGAAAEIISSSTPFTFNSAYFNAAWNNGLSITVTGLLNGVAEDTDTFQVNATGPATLESFNWTDINELDFTSSGGTSAGYKGGGTQFTMDNLTINASVAAAEPSALALTALFLLMMGGVLVRRRPAQST